jgi:hypothetical protein
MIICVFYKKVMTRLEWIFVSRSTCIRIQIMVFLKEKRY